MTATHPAQKVRARKKLNQAVAAGRVTPQPCGDCQEPKAQAHHDDYSKPLQVRWLCAGCHSKLHNQKHPLTKRCTVCAAEFTPHPTKRERAKTCSPACRSAAISATLLAKPVIPPWAKLDHDAADRIRARHAAGGATHRALAAEFGVHHSQIGAIVRGKAWVRPVVIGLSVAQGGAA